LKYQLVHSNIILSE